MWVTESAVRRTTRLAAALGAMTLGLMACAPVELADSPATPIGPVGYASVDRLPFTEYWSEISFTDSAVGFSRLRLRPTETEGEFEIRSDAIMDFALLGTERKSVLKSVDRVGPRLELRSFDYRYVVDGVVTELRGHVVDGELRVEVHENGESSELTVSLPRSLFPSSAFALYPVLNGLEVGREYAYPIFDGQSRTVKSVIQRVAGYERSEELDFDAFRIHTKLHGQEVDTWIDASGRPLLESSMKGIFTAELLDTQIAKEQLALLALERDETALQFSVVASTPPLADPQTLGRIVIELTGIDESFDLPSDEVQRCTQSGGSAVCEIENGGFEDARQSGSVDPEYLALSNDGDEGERLLKTAASIVGDVHSSGERVERLVEWASEDLKEGGSEDDSVLDILRSKRAGTHGKARTYVALARALEIPSRVVSGLVYSPSDAGFIYHSWAESRIDERWSPVDPTLGQATADVTHIKMVEGEGRERLAFLADDMGHIRAFVIAAQDGAEPSN